MPRFVHYRHGIDIATLFTIMMCSEGKVLAHVCQIPCFPATSTSTTKRFQQQSITLIRIVSTSSNTLLLVRDSDTSHPVLRDTKADAMRVRALAPYLGGGSTGIACSSGAKHRLDQSTGRLNRPHYSSTQTAAICQHANRRQQTKTHCRSTVGAATSAVSRQRKAEAGANQLTYVCLTSNGGSGSHQAALAGWLARRLPSKGQLQRVY